MRLGANNKDTPKYYLIAQQGPVQPAVSWKSEILNDFSFKLDKEEPYLGSLWDGS